MSDSIGTRFSVLHFEPGSPTDLESDATISDYDIIVTDDEPSQLSIKVELDSLETPSTSPSLNTSAQTTLSSSDNIQATPAGSAPRTIFVLLVAVVDSIARLALLICKICWITAWAVVGATCAPFVAVLRHFIRVDWTIADTLAAIWTLLFNHIPLVLKVPGALVLLVILVGILYIVDLINWVINWVIRLLPQRWQVSQLPGFLDGLQADLDIVPPQMLR